MASDLTKLSAREMARLVRERELSPVELIDAHAARIEQRNPELNAIVLPRLDEARQEALAAERAVAAGERLRPLHGVPYTAKESLAVAGMPCTLGSRLLADNVSTENAAVVRRMGDAGAILLGKTNVPEFLSYYDTSNELYGVTHNPHDPSRSAGGSSGGEAAALAAAMTPAGIGSDLGSSIRNPAHFTGVFGLCPSRDVISNVGHLRNDLPAGWRLFCRVGPMARNACDLELLLEALASAPLPDPSGGPLRVAVFEEDGLQRVAAVCREAVRRAAKVLGDAGHDVVDDRPPNAADVRDVYDRILATEGALWLLPTLSGDDAELSPYGRALISALRRVEPSLEDYMAAFRRLSELEIAADAWLDRHPIALCPVCPAPAPAVGGGYQLIDGDPLLPGGAMTLCTYASALGLPSVSVPVMRDADGLPVGVLVTGRRGRDREVLAVAHELDEAFGWLDPDSGSPPPPGPSA